VQAVFVFITDPIFLPNSVVSEFFVDVGMRRTTFLVEENKRKERASRIPTFQTSHGQLFGLKWAQPID